MEEHRITEFQLDALKEVATIGSATAATALAELIQAKVGISVPQASFVPLEKINSLINKGVDTLFVVLDMGITGDIGGRILFLISPEHAKFLAGELLGNHQKEIDLSDELSRSAMNEAANILCGAYVSVLADMIKMTILLSPPAFAMDMMGALLDFIFIQLAQDSEEALYLRTDLEVKGLSIQGLFLFFPDTASLRKILDALGVK
jgi:chemotaxis protein CheC